MIARNENRGKIFQGCNDSLSRLQIQVFLVESFWIQYQGYCIDVVDQIDFLPGSSPLYRLEITRAMP